jgi:alpha-beta hydrolase superfamily lysophospholipase
MLPGRLSDVKFEIGHVLFIDIVGYSKLLITEQSERLQTLKEIVRGTEQFRTPFDWLSRDNAEVDAFINDPLCFPSLKPDSMQSFLDAFSRLADPREIRTVRDDLPLYIFSGSEDPVGQRLEGVRVLIDRYRSAGFSSIRHGFYSGARHEMLHELNRRDVFAKLLVWISVIARRPSRLL